MGPLAGVLASVLLAVLGTTCEASCLSGERSEIHLTGRRSARSVIWRSFTMITSAHTAIQRAR